MAQGHQQLAYCRHPLALKTSFFTCSHTISQNLSAKLEENRPSTIESVFHIDSLNPKQMLLDPPPNQFKSWLQVLLSIPQRTLLNHQL